VSDVLVLSDVTKRYGAFTAVDGLSLSIGAGEIFGFLGPNGAGKTTTLRMVMSIIYPDAGQIRVLGASRAIDVKDRIGYLPEERGLYRKMTVERTLCYFGRLKGLSGAALERRIDAGLTRVGLSDWRRKRVEALSKGMQQKVQFLAATLHQPELVILDEPFSGLDPLNTELLQDMMLELRARNTTVIFSTHQMELAQRLCDRIVLINRGRKLIEGSLPDVRSRFSERIVLLDGEGDFAALAALPGVRDLRVSGGHARLELEEPADPDALLRAALQHVRLSRFEVQRPDLHQIFVRLVSGDRRGPETTE